MAAPFAQNTLYYGDNLDVLRKNFPDESVDLIYLDPPFNSNRNYNVLFRDEYGKEAESQIAAFEDTWHWTASTEQLYDDLVMGHSETVGALMMAFRTVLQRSQMMAYLVMMTARLIELHRVLKVTGSLYLHCDPTASHYLKIILDTIFGPERFLNEIIWRRTGSHNKILRFGPIHDTILYYSKSATYTWTFPKRRYMSGHIKENFVQDENGYRTNYYGNVLTGSGVRGGESGRPWRGFDPTAKHRHWAIPGALLEDLDEDLSHLRQHEKLDRLYELGHIQIVPGQAWPMYSRYLKSSDGQSLSDIWAFQPYTEGTVFGTKEGIDEDVRWLSTKDRERLGYPTQKPLALLERIIQASSNPGDIVLDPFAGCGTTIAAAQQLDRHWIGIDITHLAIAVLQYRMRDMYHLENIPVIGAPNNMTLARALALKDRYQFQWWALSLVRARPMGASEGSREGKKGRDRGIDGILTFPEAGSKPGRVVLQVKSGHVRSGDIRDLRGTLEREGAAQGVFITLEPATSEMITEALSAGYYRSPGWGQMYPRIQILTIEELLKGSAIKMPPEWGTFKKAQQLLSQPIQVAFDVEAERAEVLQDLAEKGQLKRTESQYVHVPLPEVPTTVGGRKQRVSRKA